MHGAFYSVVISVRMSTQGGQKNNQSKDEVERLKVELAEMMERSQAVEEDLKTTVSIFRNRLTSE